MGYIMADSPHDNYNSFDPLKWVFGPFAVFGCGFLAVWVISALASLALIGAAIYLIYSTATL